MSNLKNLPIGADAPEIVNAIIEIPRGSRVKIEYDPELGVFRLDRVLYSAVHYPQAYGFIPGTLWDDGDPLDILVLSDHTIGTGILLDAIPIGGLEMADDKGSDLKIIATAQFDKGVRHITDCANLQEYHRTEIEHFFETYKLLERKQVSIGRWINSIEARKAIMKARDMFLANQ